MDISNTAKVVLLAIRHIFLRYPLYIFYLIVLGILIKYRKIHYKHPFYLLLISLGFCDLLFAISTEFFSGRYINDYFYSKTEWLYGPLSIALWTPASMANPVTNILISVYRFAGVAFPMTAKVRQK